MTEPAKTISNFSDGLEAWLNRQTWRFMVIKDRAIKERVQHFYKRAFDEVVSPRYQGSAPPPGGSAA